MNKRKGATYVEYTYGRKYVPEKRYNIPQRTTIGKADPLDPTMMYPNRNFVKYFPDVELPEFRERSKRSGCIRIGSYVVIKKIIEEYRLDEMMAHIIGDRIVEQRIVFPILRITLLCNFNVSCLTALVCGII